MSFNGHFNQLLTDLLSLNLVLPFSAFYYIFVCLREKQLCYKKLFFPKTRNFELKYRLNSVHGGLSERRLKYTLISVETSVALARANFNKK